MNAEIAARAPALDFISFQLYGSLFRLPERLAASGFDAPFMVPVESAHFAMDARLMGEPGRDLLARLKADKARVRVPSYLDPCVVDFTREAEMIADYGLPRDVVEHDRAGIADCRELGFLPTQSCIAFQTVAPPRFGAHLAWGDTGAAVSANGIFGARTNFEGGPSALASALICSSSSTKRSRRPRACASSPLILRPV